MLILSGNLFLKSKRYGRRKYFNCFKSSLLKINMVLFFVVIG
jgi:hypothetical protein